MDSSKAPGSEVSADLTPDPLHSDLGAASVNRSDATRRIETSPRPRSSLWVRLSLSAAILSFGGSIVALADRGLYATLTPAFLPQALAQDIANLVIAPLLAVMAVRAGGGSPRARAVWLGLIAFTLYNEVIYAFSIPFGPLFPVWVAVLGLSLFALIDGLRDLSHEGRPVSSRLAGFSAWVLLIVAGMFALLWLSEDVPSLLNGSTPRSVQELAVPTNPVHILDYAFFLPAAVLTGVGLLRQNRLAARTAPAFYVFLLLTCVPILITPMVAESGSGAVETVIVVGLLATVLLAVLAVLVRSIRPEPSRTT